VSSLDRAGYVSQSLPKPGWDVTGDSAVIAAVTEPVTGVDGVKGGCGSSVTGPLSSVGSEPRRKKPCGGGVCEQAISTSKGN
jgi:hypothetical protein